MYMKHISISEAQKQTSPNSVTIICAQKPDGKTNLATVSWWTYLSNDPAIIGFALSKSGCTGELILAGKRLALCLPAGGISNETMKCGSVSGREVDKVALTGIEMRPLIGTPLYVPTDCKIVFNCALIDIIDTVSTNFYICRVEDIELNEGKRQLFAFDGYSTLRTL